MDSLYAQSLVMLALRDTLKELADNFFIRRDVADKIHAQGCHAVYNQLHSQANAHPHIEIRGKLHLYRFRKSIWTLFLKDPTVHIVLGSSLAHNFPVAADRTIKIVAVDQALWDRRAEKISRAQKRQQAAESAEEGL